MIKMYYYNVLALLMYLGASYDEAKNICNQMRLGDVVTGVHNQRFYVRIEQIPSTPLYAVTIV